MRSIGTVEGGAGTVIDALLATVGPDGTLVAPTFTGQYGEPGFVFDPAETPVTTGAIPNHLFRRPDARRTVHIVQTVAAIGPLRDTIIDAGGHDGWDAQPTMRTIFDLDGWFLLLGVPYQNLTAGHFMEQEIGTHRSPRVAEGLQRLGPTAAWSRSAARPGDPIPASPACRSAATTSTGWARAWSSRGLVKRGAVGNAIARLFRARDVERTAREMFAADPELFFIADGQVTPLQYGTTWLIPDGRHAGAQLCVVDPAGCFKRRTRSGGGFPAISPWSGLLSLN